MKMNLLPKEMQPTRPSPVPYTIVGGIICLATIWILTQITVAGHARYSSLSVRRDCAKAQKELALTVEVPAQLEKAKQEESALKSKAVVITMLTQDSKVFSLLLKSVVASTPPSLRLNKITLDPIVGTATITGYGAEANTDTDLSNFLIALDNDAAIAKVFENARLDSSQPVMIGPNAAKTFTILLKYRNFAPKPSETDKKPAKPTRRRRLLAAQAAENEN